MHVLRFSVSRMHLPGARTKYAQTAQHCSMTDASGARVTRTNAYWVGYVPGIVMQLASTGAVPRRTLFCIDTHLKCGEWIRRLSVDFGRGARRCKALLLCLSYYSSALAMALRSIFAWLPASFVLPSNPLLSRLFCFVVLIQLSHP